MFDNENLGISVLTNPGLMQNMVLTELNNRLNGIYSIADPNNGFNFILEASSSMNAQNARYMESEFETTYPARATTSGELYKNMSDFDYLQMVSQPSQIPARMTFDANYLIAHALPFNSDYNKVVIPAETIFYIGSYKFGLYYPIEIRINTTTNSIVVVYNDSVPNPLFTLQSNTVEYTIYPFEGLTLLTITFPVYQFTTSSNEEDVLPEQGFQQIYPYTDNFYAARVFTNINGLDSNGNPIWTEMAYTLSEVYDVTVPTAKLLLLEDNSTINVTIPQIYFTNNQIGNKLLVNIYTTAGSLNITLTTAEINSCNANFNLALDTSTRWSAILDQLPTLALQPGSVQILGGSNALTFAQLRARIVNGSLYDGVPITPIDLENFVNKNGFTLTKYLDNITQRIYYAGITMHGGANGIVPLTVANVKIDTTTIANTSSILPFDDGSITVFPTTVYQYSSLNGICTPLTNAQLSALASLTKDELVIQLNSNIYTQHPFHFVTYTTNPYPITKTFNLMNPTVTNYQFIRENANSSAQLTLVSAQVTHLNAGSGGYLLRLAVNKTTDIAALPESDITVLIATLLQDATSVYLKASWVSAAPPNSAYTDIYQISIPCNYDITLDGRFGSQCNIGPVITDCTLALQTLFDVKFLVAQTALPNVVQDFNIVASLDSSIVNGNVGIAWQQITVTFGQDLSPNIFNITDVVYSTQTYMTWPENIYYTYPQDKYTENADGTLIYTVINGEVVMNKLHSAGDNVLDAQGNPIVKHAAGSIKLDGSGNPIPLGTRTALYYVQTIQFDTRLFESQNPTDVAYVNTITSQINAYTNTIATLDSDLLEQTNLYFLPAATLGIATYNTSNGNTAQYPLGISFAYNIYINNYDPTNTIYQNLKTLITAQVSTIIAEAVTQPIISAVAIANTIQQTFSADISSIDCLGMNGDINLQTLQITGNMVAPTIALKLIHNIDNTLTLNQNIVLNFYATVTATPA